MAIVHATPMPRLLFRHPRPRLGKKARVLPVFLPWQGCPGRCAFCSQRLQTGLAPAPLAEHHARLARELERLAVGGAPPLEVGFYGATFTALPEPWPERFTALAAQYMETGLVSRIRCSTRPDACDPALLAHLRGLGLSFVELGVQSFDAQALARSRRGHGPDEALAGCRAVREAGLGLGLHLMPGLPGQTTSAFLRDIDLVVSLAPESVRLHPCVVLAGTPLADEFASGAYRPWSLGRTITLLALALLRLWSRAIPVIRMGVAPEDSFVTSILAGPWHPALGQRAASLALFLHSRALTASLGRPPRRLLHPSRLTSDVRGWQGELLPSWRRLGLAPDDLVPWERDFFLLET